MHSAFGVVHEMATIAKDGAVSIAGDAVKVARKGKLRRVQDTESLARQLKASGKSDRVDSPARPGVFSSRARKQAWDRGWS